METKTIDGIEFRQSPTWPELYASACGLVCYLSSKVTQGSLTSDGYYQVSYYAYPGARQKRVYAHRVVMDSWVGPSALPVDHIKGPEAGNGLTNLRYITTRGNAGNRKGHRKGTYSSQYLGVHWHKPNKKWLVQFNPPGIKKQHVGLFIEELAAATAYDDECEKYGLPRANHT